MKGEREIKELLIQNTVQLIADGGFEKATTKAITHSGGNLDGIKMNEVYIYRLFGSKDHLYEEAFESLDDEFLYGVRVAFEHVHDLAQSPRDKMYIVFEEAWHFVLQNEAHCRCYLRFYHSVYFKGEAIQKHNERFQGIVAEFAPLFKAEADAYSVMHSVLTTMLDFAVRVFNGDLADNEINRPHIFNVLYCIMMIYFKEDLQADRII